MQFINKCICIKVPRAMLDIGIQGIDTEPSLVLIKISLKVSPFIFTLIDIMWNNRQQPILQPISSIWPARRDNLHAWLSYHCIDH